MRPELEHGFRKAELGKYLLAAANADASIEEALEQGFQEGVMQERERHLAIDRAVGPDAFKAAELLTSAIKSIRKVDYWTAKRARESLETTKTLADLLCATRSGQRSVYQMAYVDLITRNSLARAGHFLRSASILSFCAATANRCHPVRRCCFSSLG
jgi:hypothetical protein